MSDLNLETRGLAMGDPIIDRQHAEILRRAANLKIALQEGRGDEQVAELLAFLEDYTMLHLASEEALMVRIAYPALAAHRRDHAELLEAVRRLASDFRRNGPSRWMAARVHHAIFGLFLSHVETSDRGLARFLACGRMDAPARTRAS